MDNKEDFPACFPDDFFEKLSQIKVETEALDVYRVGKNGENNREAFKSTYEEYIAGEITDKDLDPNDPLINYSTSCNYKRAKIRGILKMCLKRHTRAKLLKGKTEITCGPSQITKNRCPERKSDGHVDWWLYKESSPQEYFEICEEKNNV